MNRLLLEILICCYFLKLYFIINYTVFIYISFYLYKFLKFLYYQYSLKSKINVRRLEQEINFNNAYKYSKTLNNEIKNKISKLKYPQLRELLIKKEIKCTDILKAYITFALNSTKNTNSVVLFIDWAQNIAEELDLKFNDESFNISDYPLFGLPISIKESTPIKGYDPTFGFVSRIGIKSSKNSNLIQHLISKGAIPFCLTNVPQSLLTFDCNNPIYGRTTHPLNKSRTSGGSSGGEAALIASGGSLIGFGSDLGGSLRVPAHFSGCVSIKPGSTRLSSVDALPVVPGRPYLECGEGPLGCDVNTCVLMLSNLMDADMVNNDFQVPPIPWRENIFLQKPRNLKIGYYVDDGWFTPCPAVIRAVLETTERLENLGYELVEFKPPKVDKAFQLMIGTVNVDGGSYLLNLFSKDKIMSEYIPLLTSFFFPHLIRLFLANTFGKKYPRLEVILNSIATSSSHLQQIFSDIQDYQRLFEKTMNDYGIDLILCPPCAAVSLKIKEGNFLTPAFSYTSMFNLLDYPAGVLPVTHVTKTDILKMKDYQITDTWSQVFKESMSSDDVENLPVGIQIAGPPYSEELICKVLLEIEQSINQL